MLEFVADSSALLLEQWRLIQAFFVHPRKKLKGPKTQETENSRKNSKLKPKTQFSGIFQKILQIVYFLKRRYNLS